MVAHIKDSCQTAQMRSLIRAFNIRASNLCKVSNTEDSAETGHIFRQVWIFCGRTTYKAVCTGITISCYALT